MKKKHIHKEKTSDDRPPADSRHPLAGTWEQQPNSFHTTSVVYTINATNDRFVVSGVDESNGNLFKISRTGYNGETLRFTSLFPPTNHKAKHVFRLLGKGRASHLVSYTDEDGSYTEQERWRKRPRNKTQGKRLR